MKVFDKLTKRQKAIYDFILKKIQSRGYGPTVREIGDQFGIMSPNGVVCHLKALQKKGFIKREANMSRAIQVLVEPPTGLPVIGVITDTGMQTIEDVTESVDPGKLFGTTDLAAAKVQTEALAAAGIMPGDVLVIRKKRMPKKDQAVLVELGGGIAMRRWVPEKSKGRVRLEGINEKVRPSLQKSPAVIAVVMGVVRNL